MGYTERFPDTQFLKEVAINQLRQHLPPLVFEYFEWTINENPFADQYELRGESHSRVELRERISMREFDFNDPKKTEKIKYYHPKPFHICTYFERHGDEGHLKIAFDRAIAEMVSHLRFLEKANDIQELEAWIILSQKPPQQ